MRRYYRSYGEGRATGCFPYITADGMISLVTVGGWMLPLAVDASGACSRGVSKIVTPVCSKSTVNI